MRRDENENEKRRNKRISLTFLALWTILSHTCRVNITTFNGKEDMIGITDISTRPFGPSSTIHIGTFIPLVKRIIRYADTWKMEKSPLKLLSCAYIKPVREPYIRDSIREYFGCRGTNTKTETRAHLTSKAF